MKDVRPGQVWRFNGMLALTLESLAPGYGWSCFILDPGPFLFNNITTLAIPGSGWELYAEGDR